MSEESEAPTQEPTEIDKIKDDFRKEMEEFKLTFQKEMETRDAKIKELSDINEQLRASLLRETVYPAPEQPKEKTPEELYQEEVMAGAEKMKTFIIEQLGVKLE